MFLFKLLWEYQGINEVPTKYPRGGIHTPFNQVL